MFIYQWWLNCSEGCAVHRGMCRGWRLWKSKYVHHTHYLFIYFLSRLLGAAVECPATIFIFWRRFSCGSATPVSSDSSDSSPSNKPPLSRPLPPREPPPALPLDLLTEMEFLFDSKKTQRRDSFPNSSHNSDISLPDKAVSQKRLLILNQNVDVVLVASC